MRSILPTARSASLNRVLVPLVHAIARGDQPAFAEFYRLTSGRMLWVCNQLLRDESDAQEILQDVYLVVWLKAAGFDETRSIPTTWLTVIARNKAIDSMRRYRPLTSDLSEAANVVDDCSSALEIMLAEQDRILIHECIDKLEPRSKRLVQAAFFASTTHLELARSEAVPLGTMKSWLRRSLLRLRVSMAETL